MAEQIIKAKVIRKAGNGKGFQLENEDGWFNAVAKIMEDLKKIEVGNLVEISYIKKGIKKEVVSIKAISTEKTKTEQPKEENKPTCSVCGKELKDNKYSTCWGCKDKKPEQKKNQEYNPPSENEERPEKTTYHPKSNYDNPEKTAQIQRGNALNAAGMAVGGNFQGSDPQTIAEATKVIAQELLDWLRAE